MQTRLAVFVLVAVGLSQTGTIIVETKAPNHALVAQPLQSGQTTIRYNVEYKCGGETVVIGHCRSDSDRLGMPATRPEEDYCQVYYPDRPKRNEFTAMGTELRSDSAVTGSASHPARWKKCRRRNRVSSYAGGVLGFAYLNLKQYPNAVAALQQTIRLEPNDADTVGVYDLMVYMFHGFTRAYTHYLLGFTYVQMGKKEVPYRFTELSRKSIRRRPRSFLRRSIRHLRSNRLAISGGEQ